VTADPTVWVYFEQEYPGYDIYVACTDDTCDTCDDAYGVVDGYIMEDVVASSKNFYLLMSQSVYDDSSSGSILSFAAVALCALVTLLF